MNVIFTNFDGTLNTVHHSSNNDIEKRIILLSDICKFNNCKLVISSGAKNSIDVINMSSNIEWVNFILECFKKYNNKPIDITPTVGKRIGSSFYPSWKEDEIRLYLYNHPEVEHYCVLDYDIRPYNSDLDQVRDHLIETIYYSNNPDEEGLLEKHKDEIEDILKLDNEVKQLSLMRKQSSLLIKTR